MSKEDFTQNPKVEILSDGKNVNKKSAQRDNAIKILQNYYSIAVSQNEDVFSMKNTVSAVLFHCSESSDDERQQLGIKIKLTQSSPLREKCPYSELFWSPFSRIRTEYREILCISPYLSVFSPNAGKCGPE